METTVYFIMLLPLLTSMQSYVDADTEAGFETELEILKNDQRYLLQEFQELKRQFRLSNVALNCHDMKLRSTELTSGFYTIDPDGIGVGDPPITVYCHMDTGTTEITHQYSEKEVEIKMHECNTAGCERYSISYPVPLSQIAALTEASESCTQDIQFSCLLASFEFNGEQQGWWVDRHDNKQIYWTGSYPGQHICSCALSGEKRCLQPEQKCNCDSKDPVWHSDVGTLTNKSVLPVTAIHYGNIDSSFIDLHAAKFMLGPLKCSGKSDAHPSSSCRKMKRVGNTVPGYYILKPEDSEFPEIVYCDMEKTPDEVGFQTSLGSPGTLRKTVIFDVYLSSGRNKKDAILTYDGINVNLSDGMDYTTGIFTAPVSGFYFFSFSALAEKGDFNHVTLHKDGKIITAAYDHNLFSSSRYSMLSFSISLDVNKGERVYIKNMRGRLWDSDDKYAHFSGHLLQPKLTIL